MKTGNDGLKEGLLKNQRSQEKDLLGDTEKELRVLNNPDDEEVDRKAQKTEEDLPSYSECAMECALNSLPVIAGLLFETLIEVINLIFIGNLNDPTLMAGLGLGTLMINVIGISISTGLCGGIDTLVSQCHGQKNYYRCGVNLNRCRVLMLLVFIPQAVIFFYTDKILEAVGQDPKVSEAALDYTKVLIPGVLVFNLFEATRRFLNAQLVFALPSKIQFSTLVLHILWCYIFVSILELEIVGAAVASLITYTLDFVLIHVYVSCFEVVPSESWHWFDKNSFKGLINYCKYGVPSLVIVCLEWWCIEFLSIFAGWLSETELAANVALLNLNYIVYNLPLGMSYAICSMVGNSLGSNLPQRALRYVKTSMIIALVICIMTIITFLTFKVQFSTIFTTESKVVEIMLQLIPVYCLLIICDYIQGVQGGIIRGMGYQSIATVIVIISYWLVAIPVSYIFAFILDYRIIGIWLGLPAGSLLICSSFSAIIYFTNWEKLATKIHDHP
ncbi:unnamed protein product [Moneuplotes crassus]|uniref:Multidrug and toxin extrusion protein n=1 Tax=Euplotes crassus TaxID=5936 RepID=A0AAD1XAG9_EUPCR|nr:unnamed protein product [Moneuplotes crassus]